MRAAGAVYPGSESRTCFHSNCSCRLVPAHQGMKSRSCGLVQRIGTADSATPHPDPCGGQAPALHILIPPSATGLQVGTFRPLRAGIEVDWRAYPGSESGTCFRTNRSCRLAPAHQGMKSRSCGLVQRIGTVGFCHAPPRPLRGTSPRATYSHSALGHRSTSRHVSPVRAGIEVDWRAGIDEIAGHGGVQRRARKRRRRIFVSIGMPAGAGTRGMRIGCIG